MKGSPHMDSIERDYPKTVIARNKWIATVILPLVLKYLPEALVDTQRHHSMVKISLGNFSTTIAYGSAVTVTQDEIRQHLSWLKKVNRICGWEELCQKTEPESDRLKS
jgi:hypothetical protein